MLDYVEIVNIHKKKYFYYQGKERPAKTKLVPAKLRTVHVSLHEVWLNVVLVNFGFSKNFENISTKQHMDPTLPVL